MSKINPNNFTEPLKLLNYSKEKGSMNQVQETFTEDRTVFGELLPGAIGENVSDGVVNYAENYVFNTWYNSDITAKDRFNYNGDQYDIVSIVPLENKKYSVFKIAKVYE